MNKCETLKDYFEIKGFQCPLCLDPYDLKERNKFPTQLSCRQHSVCIECLQQQIGTLKLCPQCREPLTFSAGVPAPNSQMLTAMEAIAEIWESAHPSASSSAAAAAAPVDVPTPPAPINFECLTFCEAFWQYRDIQRLMRESLDSIIHTMGWHREAKELTDSLNYPEWVLLSDHNQESQGIAQLKIAGPTQWEAHWIGVVEANPANYVEFYKQLLLMIKRRGSDDWKNVSFTSYFNYDLEEVWLSAVLRMLGDHNLRYELTYLHKTWGAQAKLRVFPWPKAGHIQRELVIDPNKKLETDIPFGRRVGEQLSYRKINLTPLFRALAAETADPAGSEQRMLSHFSDFPQFYFFYLVEGQAKGFMQFERSLADTNKLFLTLCKLMPDSLRYADHFVQQFAEWATTKPTLDKDTSATGFISNLSHLPPLLQEAIRKYAG